MKIVAASALALLISLSAAASYAQSINRAPNTPAVRAEAPRPRLNASPSAVAGQLQTRTPRFTLKMLRFEVLDETGSTNVGSDEVQVVFNTPNYWMRTSLFGDVDTGESRTIPTWQHCIYPARDNATADSHWSCEHQGRPGPISFSITLREHDHDYDRIVGCEHLGRFNDLIPTAANCYMYDYEADRIGSFSREFTAAQLVRAMPEPWGELELVQSVGSHDSHYRIHYRIVRTSDLIGPPTTLGD